MSDTAIEKIEQRGLLSTDPLKDQLARYEMFWSLAEKFAASDLVSKSLKGPSPEKTRANVFTAITFGDEIGLSPMTSIQNIYVVDGKPSTYGDIQLGLVRASGKLEYIKESFEGEFPKDEFKAVCILKRVGEDERKFEFSIGEARTAGIWEVNVWKKYPKRMLMFRPRGTGLRDIFPDVLKGLHSVEEMDGQTIEMEKESPSKYRIKKQKLAPANQIVDEDDPVPPPSSEHLDTFKDIIDNMGSEAEIRAAIPVLREDWINKITVPQEEELKQFITDKIASLKSLAVAK